MGNICIHSLTPQRDPEEKLYKKGLGHYVEIFTQKNVTITRFESKRSNHPECRLLTSNLFCTMAVEEG